MDSETFDWLGAVVDNLVMISAKTPSDRNLKKSLELKSVYFDTGIKRLAGGIDNAHSTVLKFNTVATQQVITTSFVVQYVKFNAANALKQDLYFKVPPPLNTVRNSKPLEVIMPNQKDLLYGRNIIMAIMYSAQAGEQYENYMKHNSEEVQLRFFSGVAKIMVAHTPQAFATKKSFEVTKKIVRGLKVPIKMRIPVNAKDNDKFHFMPEKFIRNDGS